MPGKVRGALLFLLGRITARIRNRAFTFHKQEEESNSQACIELLNNGLVGLAAATFRYGVEERDSRIKVFWHGSMTDFDAKLFDLVAGARDRLSWSADEPRFSGVVAGPAGLERSWVRVEGVQVLEVNC